MFSLGWRKEFVDFSWHFSVCIWSFYQFIMCMTSSVHSVNNFLLIQNYYPQQKISNPLSENILVYKIFSYSYSLFFNVPKSIVLMWHSSLFSLMPYYFRSQWAMDQIFILLNCCLHLQSYQCTKQENMAKYFSSRMCIRQY